MTWAQVFYNLMASALIHFHNTNSFDIGPTRIFTEFYQPEEIAKRDQCSLYYLSPWAPAGWWWPPWGRWSAGCSAGSSWWGWRWIMMNNGFPGRSKPGEGVVDSVEHGRFQLLDHILFYFFTLRHNQPGSRSSPGSRQWSRPGCSARHYQGSWDLHCEGQCWWNKSSRWEHQPDGVLCKVEKGETSQVVQSSRHPGQLAALQVLSKKMLQVNKVRLVWMMNMVWTLRLRFFRDCSSPLKAPSARVMLLSENFSVFNLHIFCVTIT